MTIDSQTKIGALLDAYPELEQTLLQLSPAFAKLTNPVLRRTVAKVATIEQAAKIAGISPVVMVQTLRKKAGLDISEHMADNEEWKSETTPEWFDQSKITIHFDAGPIINAGKSPLTEIMRLADGLCPGDIMELSAPFRPEPIMEKLKDKGYHVWYNGGKTYFFK